MVNGTEPECIELVGIGCLETDQFDVESVRRTVEAGAPQQALEGWGIYERAETTFMQHLLDTDKKCRQQGSLPETGFFATYKGSWANAYPRKNISLH